MPMRTRLRSGAGRRVNYRSLAGLKSRTTRRAPVRSKPSVVRIKQRTLPDKIMVKLPYADLQGFNGGGTFNYYAQKSYNINSVYDPETGALNQQNLGFAQYMALYNKFRVYKVDYDITLVNTSQSAVAGSISFSKQGEQMNILDPQQLAIPFSRRFTLGLGGSSTSSSAQSMKRIKGSIYLPRVVGKTSEQYRTNDIYVGTNSANPSEIIQMSLNCINVNQSVQATIQADVRYTCHIEFFDRDTSTLQGTDAPIEEV